MLVVLWIEIRSLQHRRRRRVLPSQQPSAMQNSSRSRLDMMSPTSTTEHHQPAPTSHRACRRYLFHRRHHGAALPDGSTKLSTARYRGGFRVATPRSTTSHFDVTDHIVSTYVSMSHHKSSSTRTMKSSYAALLALLAAANSASAFSLSCKWSRRRRRPGIVPGSRHCHRICEIAWRECDLPSMIDFGATRGALASPD